ncbi:MAG: VOC family protein [Candidatus Eremiobacteraeota bacterium]|nr:VOC family protein [Candidatus Eremiobacteraeota bacterium]
MVKDVAFFAYSVKDVPAAIKFYRDVVGLKPGDMFSEHWAEFDVGATTFGVGNGTPLGFIPGNSTGAAFEVDNIAQLRDKLIEHDVTVTELKEMPNCSVVFVTDPEGNKFALHQRKK